MNDEQFHHLLNTLKEDFGLEFDHTISDPDGRGAKGIFLHNGENVPRQQFGHVPYPTMYYGLRMTLYALQAVRKNTPEGYDPCGRCNATGHLFSADGSIKCLVCGAKGYTPQMYSRPVYLWDPTENDYHYEDGINSSWNNLADAIEWVKEDGGTWELIDADNTIVYSQTEDEGDLGDDE